MPKRVPKDEKPFRPVENALIQSVMDEAVPLVKAPEPAPAPAPATPVVQRENVVPLSPKVEPQKAPEPAPVRAMPRRQPIERFQLTSTEKAELTGFSAELSEVLGATVKPSNLHRAMLILQKNARRQILQRAQQQTGQLYRPSNDNYVAAAEFDYRLAKIISAAMRDAAPLHEA